MNKALMLVGALLLSTAAVAQPAPPPPGGARMDGPPPPPPPHGAHFRVERPNTTVDIKCGSEPAKPCIDAAMTLIDKLGSMMAR